MSPETHTSHSQTEDPPKELTTMSTSYTLKSSIEAIPILKGQENYKIQAKPIKSHLKASNAWDIIKGKWQKPQKPNYYRPPLYPQDFINEHKAKHKATVAAKRGPLGNSSYKVVETGSNDTSVLLITAAQLAQLAPRYIEMTIEEAKKQLKYIKNYIKEWNKWESVKCTTINNINLRMLATYREELEELNNLKKI